MERKKANQSHFHRSQIGRAQRYIRLHLVCRVPGMMSVHEVVWF
jgi:hypothetical protein